VRLYDMGFGVCGPRYATRCANSRRRARSKPAKLVQNTFNQERSKHVHGVVDLIGRHADNSSLKVTALKKNLC